MTVQSNSREGTTVRTVLALAIAIAGIAYSSWLLEFLLDTGLNPTNSFLSGSAHKSVGGQVQAVGSLR